MSPGLRSARGLEALGAQQRCHEIDEKEEGDGAAQDQVEHGGGLKALAADDVEGQEREAGEAEADKKDVEQVGAPKQRRLRSPKDGGGARKESMGDCPPLRKEPVKAAG